MNFSPTIIIMVLLFVIVASIVGWFFARRADPGRLNHSVEDRSQTGVQNREQDRLQDRVQDRVPDRVQDQVLETRQDGEAEHDQMVNALDSITADDPEMNRIQRYEGDLQIHDLTPEDREQYHTEWAGLRSNFAYEPDVALVGADHLVQNVMRKRAYPVTDFEQRAADLSVSYPALVSNYQSAHGIALKHERGEANPEEVSGAMDIFGSLFDELLGTDEEES